MDLYGFTSGLFSVVWYVLLDSIIEFNCALVTMSVLIVLSSLVGFKLDLSTEPFLALVWDRLAELLVVLSFSCDSCGVVDSDDEPSESGFE